MQIQRVQSKNYTPTFQGVLKFQNLKNGGKVTEKITSIDLDKGLAFSALDNLFSGSWANEGCKNIRSNKIARYAEALRQTLGINIPCQCNEFELIQLKKIDNGYIIKADGRYKLTHLREDIFCE